MKGTNLNEENLWLLQNRLSKILNVVLKNGEENFYIAFSGGYDSTVLSWLIDKALPSNKIPRVYSDTGIELNMIRDFVYNKAKNDDRFIILKPSKNIKDMLNEKGYPFKSKKHAGMVKLWQKFKTTENHAGLEHYLGIGKDGIKWSAQNTCPKCLKYQFTHDFNIKVSDQCCIELKENPMLEYQKTNKKKIAIVGLMKEEGGRRQSAQCEVFRNNKLTKFQPLVNCTKEWERWLVDRFNIDICDIYKPPYNFIRTGCKGCPFARNLQSELETLEKYFPNERKQCEYIWKPIYDEYRRIGYRLKE